MQTTGHDKRMRNLDTKRDIVTKLQVTQRPMERCMLDIPREARKRLASIKKETPLTDVIHKFRSREWQWPEYLAIRKDNRWTTRKMMRRLRSIKRFINTQILRFFRVSSQNENILYSNEVLITLLFYTCNESK